MPLMFEQQPRESTKAFAAFALYLNMGPQRSVRAVAVQLGKSVGLIERWSAKFDWPGRVQAHTQHMAALERKAEAQVVREIALEKAKREAAQEESEWETRCEALALARETIRRWRKEPDKFGTLEGIARLLELSSKLGRLSCGMATDKTERLVEEKRTLSVEFKTAIEKIYGQPVPAEFIEVEGACARPPEPVALPEVQP